MKREKEDEKNSREEGKENEKKETRFKRRKNKKERSSQKRTLTIWRMVLFSKNKDTLGDEKKKWSPPPFARSKLLKFKVQAFLNVFFEKEGRENLQSVLMCLLSTSLSQSAFKVERIADNFVLMILLIFRFYWWRFDCLCYSEEEKSFVIARNS